MQLNHVFKTRDIVTKNEKKLAKEKESKTEGILDSESFLDQGFTRPKVNYIIFREDRNLVRYYFYYNKL